MLDAPFSQLYFGPSFNTLQLGLPAIAGLLVTESAQEAAEFGEITGWLGLRRSRSSKVTEFGSNRKLICDF